MNAPPPDEGGLLSLEQTLERERTARRICAELNGFVDLEPTILSVTTMIRDLTGCEAVGVRLHDDGDYPYFVHEGFPERFILRENSLCSRAEGGGRLRRAEGEGYELDCMCGNVIHGRIDDTLPFFTPAGSFWSNGTTALLASSTEEDRQGRTRNYCNSCGYESVALIPIRAHGERIGLIQLNDRREDRFTLDLIEYLEMLGEQVGVAVRSSLIHSRLRTVTEELVRSNEDLEQFASAVSHDLQQPLSVLQGYADLLSMSCPAAADSPEQGYIRGILDGSQRMETMIREILAYSRAARQVRSDERVDLARVVRQVIDDLGAEIDRKGARITHDELPTIDGSAVLLTQLLQNLIGNAMKFHGESPPRIHLSAESEAEAWRIAVRDSGIGIAAEERERVFGLFRRASAAERYPGTGVGLAICRKIVTRFGGRIWVESEPGRGSTFLFTLPR